MVNSPTNNDRKYTELIPKNESLDNVPNLKNIETLSLLIDAICNSNDYQLTNKLLLNLVEQTEKELLIFNSKYQKIIKSVCHTFNSPTGFYIPSVLSAVSVAIGKNVVIQDSRGVKEKAALYVCIVGNSGTGKTPAVNWCINPIKRIEAENWKQYQQEKTEAEANEQEFTPKYKTSYVTDATTEALTTRLNNSDGILYFRDELIGWLNDMNKYRSNGSDDLLFMQIWNSNDTIRIERQSKSIFIENPYLNVLGGTQPKRLNSFTKKVATDSGFFQRILFSYPKAEIQDRRNVKENKELKELYNNLITNIYKKCRSNESELILEMSENGNNLITDFVNNFIRKQQRLFKNNSLIVESLSKLETYILRFTLIFEMMDAKEINWTGFVSDTSITKAIAIVLYFYFYTQKIIYSSEQNALYTNDSDRIIHSILSSKFSKGETFTTGQVLEIINKRYSKPTVNKHLKDTGRYFYENLGRGKYQML